MDMFDNLIDITQQALDLLKEQKKSRNINWVQGVERNFNQIKTMVNETQQESGTLQNFNHLPVPDNTKGIENSFSVNPHLKRNDMMIVTERNGLDTENGSLTSSRPVWTSSQDSNFGFWRKDLNLDAVPNFRRLPETWTSALNFEFGNLPGFALWLWKIRLEFTSRERFYFFFVLGLVNWLLLIEKNLCFKSFGTLGLGRKLIFLKFTTFNTFKFRIHPGVIKFTALENDLSDEVDVAGTVTYILAI
ncbi:hypothetical protein RhiirA4_549240 [Rhizophagus irregularis]|uniref:Uncharacterized protein n=1 Tax=Rhizophagus irregularis TaxID=588596 RepID=A0A2I1HCA9_9GLOM|nr:hypothetical protein RhiirA4_549240 [Rhizophagus irregularis]